MQKLSVGIIGASGYSGVELTRLLSNHPRLEPVVLTSDRWHGSTVGQKLGMDGALGARAYAPQDKSAELGADCEVVFLATPAEVSLELVPRLVQTKVKHIVDLSGAFRLKDATLYPTFYNFEHGAKDWLARAVYGLPELSREGLVGARLISNPGCYATAAALALAPLLRKKLVEESYLIVDAASGTTGAGRKATEDMSFTEVNEDFRAYRVHRHQHTPEISQTLSLFSGLTCSLTFTPHLLPIKRGILVTAYARLKPGVDPAAPARALAETYSGARFVSVAKTADEVNLKAVVGTNKCVVAAAAPPSPNQPVIVVAAIDNLVKGAAGQALQNLNLAMGWDEGLGLDSLRGFYP